VHEHAPRLGLEARLPGTWRARPTRSTRAALRR